MPKARTFIGINYYWHYLFLAKTKVEGGVKLHRALKKDGHDAANPVALAKYVGQLFYSPQFQVLWYRISLWEKEHFRVMYASQIPEELWSGIEEADPTSEPRKTGHPLSLRKKSPEIKQAKFRKLAGMTK